MKHSSLHKHSLRFTSIKVERDYMYLRALITQEHLKYLSFENGNNEA